MNKCLQWLLYIWWCLWKSSRNLINQWWKYCPHRESRQDQHFLALFSALAFQISPNLPFPLLDIRFSRGCFKLITLVLFTGEISEICVSVALKWIGKVHFVVKSYLSQIVNGFHFPICIPSWRTFMKWTYLG